MHTAEGAAAVDAFAGSQNFKISMLGRSNVHCTRHDEGRVKPQFNKRSNTNNNNSNPQQQQPQQQYGGNVTSTTTSTVPANNYSTYNSTVNSTVVQPNTSAATVSYTPMPPQQVHQAYATSVTQQQQQSIPVTQPPPGNYQQPPPPHQQTAYATQQPPPVYDANNHYVTSTSTAANYDVPTQPNSLYTPAVPQQQQQQQQPIVYSYNATIPYHSQPQQQQQPPVTNTYPPVSTYSAVPTNNYNTNNQQVQYNTGGNPAQIPVHVAPASNIPPPPPPPPTKIVLSNLPPTIQPSDVVSWLMKDLNMTISRCTLEYLHASNTTLAHLTVPKGSNVLMDLSRKSQLTYKNHVILADQDVNPPSDGRAIPIGMGAPVTSNTPTIKPSNVLRGGRGRGGSGRGSHSTRAKYQPY